MLHRLKRNFGMSLATSISFVKGIIKSSGKFIYHPVAYHNS
jgi:hypothetical protein